MKPVKVITDAAGLLAAAALKTAKVTVRGASLVVRELSLEARDAFIAGNALGPKQAAIAAIIHGVINADTGRPLLTEEQAAELAQSSADFINELATEVLKVSGLADEPGKD